MSTAAPPVTGRTMALDVGDRRIGVAITDPLGLFARPLSTVDRRVHADAVGVLAAEARKWEVTRIVIGLPLLPSGDRGEQAAAAEAFAADLATRVDLPLEFWDESYTTLAATEHMQARGGDPRRERDRVDAVAAAVILEEWLRARDEVVRRREDL